MFRNESVSGCGFLYIKTRNHQKIAVQNLPKHEKNHGLTENQKSTEYRNINKMGTQFLHLSCQGEVRTLEPPSVTPLFKDCVVPLTVQE